MDELLLSARPQPSDFPLFLPLDQSVLLLLIARAKEPTSDIAVLLAVLRCVRAGGEEARVGPRTARPLVVECVHGAMVTNLEWPPSSSTRICVGYRSWQQ